jgi:hypothetical protein
MLKKISLRFVNPEIEKEYYLSCLESIKGNSKSTTKLFCFYFSILLLIGLTRLIFWNKLAQDITSSSICLASIVILFFSQKYSTILRANFGIIYGLIMFISVTESCIYLNKAFPLQQ